jgi:putative glycosyltransferase
MRLSIVTTLYRSAASLREFHQRVTQAASSFGDYEIVYVNDGSPDQSLQLALELFRVDPHVRLVDLARNFGHHKAMMTGLAHARGDLVFLIDSDLEEDPELLATFADVLRESEADVVYGVQQRRRGDFVERWSGWLFFKVFNVLSDHRIPENVLTVRLMTRRYVSALLAHRERETTIAGLWAITGFRQVARPVAKHVKSPTTYSLVHRIDVLVNAITSFSHRPLILIFYLGLVIGCAASAAAVYLVIRRLFFGIALPGWPSLIVSVWMLGGLMLISIGIVGIYLSRVFIETKQRPYTIVSDLYEHVTESATLDDSRDRGKVLR